VSRWSRRKDEEPAPVITLVTDYGTSDIYAGVLHGVIARICPEAMVIDLNHRVPAGDLLAGALALADALPFTPVGVHVAVVDPGVGSNRRALALRCWDGRVLVGPDNGLLGPAAALCGGVVEAVEITHSPWRLDPLSATFHGRDVFAPVAASLAAGKPFVAAGDPLEIRELIDLALPAAEIYDRELVVTVTSIDTYGNLLLLARETDAQAAGFRPGAPVHVASAGGRRKLYARYGHTFSDVGAGRLVLYAASSGRLALAVNGASAADTLWVGPGDSLVLTV
jgi:S-adenosylmethionine hydrolase